MQLQKLWRTLKVQSESTMIIDLLMDLERFSLAVAIEVATHAARSARLVDGLATNTWVGLQ